MLPRPSHLPDREGRHEDGSFIFVTGRCGGKHYVCCLLIENIWAFLELEEVEDEEDGEEEKDDEASSSVIVLACLWQAPMYWSTTASHHRLPRRVALPCCGASLDAINIRTSAANTAKRDSRSVRRVC